MTALTREDIVAVLRPADDTVVARLVALGATREELAEAYAWLQNDEALINSGRRLASGRVREVIDILQEVEDDAPGIAPPDQA